MLEELQPGDLVQVGPYRLTGVLGAGGMGRVFLGWSSGGRPVAVKVIKPELAAGPEFRARFRREVAAARTVSGLYTALLIDADVDGPVPWLATAYVDGPSLNEAVTSYGELRACAEGRARELTALGIEAGDVVSLSAPAPQDFLEMALGIWAAGAVLLAVYA